MSVPTAKEANENIDDFYGWLKGCCRIMGIKPPSKKWVEDTDKLIKELKGVKMEIMTLDEFKIAIKSQGTAIENVTFRCPRCKTLQCGQDLIDAEAGSNFDEIEKYLAFSCVGRWDKNKGCDWTLGGLFQIHELEVVTPDGVHHPRFKPEVVK